MRRIPRLGLLVASSAPKCACAAPATLPVSATAAARRAFSTTPAQKGERLRKLLVKDDGKSDGVQLENPSDPDALKALKQKQLERDLAEAEAELAEWNAAQQEFLMEQEEEESADGAAPASRTKTKRPKRPFSRLKVINEPTRAPTEKALKSETYIPALSADGLKTIGGFEGWWDKEGHWGEESEYKLHESFSQRIIATKITDPYVCEALVRQAVIETVAAMAAGKQTIRAWSKADRTSFNMAMKLSLEISEDGKSLSVGGSKKVADDLIDYLRPGTKKVIKEEIISPKEARSLLETVDGEWKKATLESPRFRFAVHKRIFQLTGNYVHDAKLAQLETIQDLINVLIEHPKPAKVADAIREQGALSQLLNVQVHDRRVTSIDKEIAVGRWKVITKELKKRDLPVTGHKQLPNPVQRQWVLGQTGRTHKRRHLRNLKKNKN